jgi:ubiquinone/menaquinone biosynthesis C-methylase UbiE
MVEIWTIQDFFRLGLDREIPPLLMPPEGPQLNLGPGRRKVVKDTIGLGLENGWDARTDHIPFAAEEVAAIHCYQFIEHFNGDEAVQLLREMERVLMPEGVVYIACPYYKSAMAYQALDHKSWWNEEIWHWLFGNEYYDDHEGEGWQLSVHACFIMGIVERNINLFTQLVKSGE